MKRNGHTKAGTVRWRCKACNASTTFHYESGSKDFEQFLQWLFGRNSQGEIEEESRSFRRHIKRYWDYWALPPVCEDKGSVIHVDGLYLSRRVVVLIASGEEGPLGWYLARSENSHAWGALLRRISAPELVVTDGGTGFEKARRKLWPQTKVQRCLCHVFCQLRRMTSSRPNLPAGQELYALGKELLHIRTAVEASLWTQHYLDWSKRWNSFLQERTYTDQRHWFYTHEHLHRARSGLNRLISQNFLFTYLENPEYPSTNNRIEGGINSQLRAMLYAHRGMPLLHRIKAVFCWCYIHSPNRLPLNEVLKVMPTYKEIGAIYRRMTAQEKNFEELPQWGDSIVWSELHHLDTFLSRWD